MAHGTRVVWDPSFTRYDFGPGHPMAPVRLELTALLAGELGLLDAPGVQVVGAEPADDALLATAHDPGYVAAVRAAGQDPSSADPARGLGTDDDPAFTGMHEAAARVVRASVDAALAVWSGQVLHAVNWTGGMHHAMADRASGFCVYNDLVAAVRALLDAGAQRVAVVDVDVHHGDGTEAAFWDDPRVLTISVHESGAVLFPGTGFPDDVGGPGAPGSAVNTALPPGTGDAGWLRALHAVVPPLLRAFEPQVLVSQHGCDTHALDPLGHLEVSLDAQRVVGATLHGLAHELCEGRWLATGGGGYELVDVVPRAWTHLLAEAVHRPVPPQTPVPAAWQQLVAQRLGRQAPELMTDGRDGGHRSWSEGYDPDCAVDRAVLATRRAVFPLHGLDVLLD